MDSGRQAVVPWAELPSELLQTISGRLLNISDIIRFRSVCRSWRSSTSLPPNKISLFFPLTLSYTTLPPARDKNLTINAAAVFLLRPRSDPSRVRMVSVQEPVAGTLTMRHVLTHEELSGGRSFPDLLSGEWISATQIAKSYTHDILCGACSRISKSMKSDFVLDDDDKLVGLCQEEDWHRAMFTYTIRVHDKEAITLKRMHRLEHKRKIVDFVSFKGKIYVVDFDGCFYECGDKNFECMVRLDCDEDFGNEYHAKKRFVVSDGDLYVVLRPYKDGSLPECYRLVRECKWERVCDLGNRVLFITDGCSFSVSAEDLPHPWKGNCIVFADKRPMHSDMMCRILREVQEIKVFWLEDGDQGPQFGSIRWFQGYSDLFGGR